MQKKDVALLSIAIVAVVGITLGLTYALWSSTSTQTGDNVITTGCFNITFTESAGSDINLQSAYPITDSDGMNTTPYEFTIENTCDISANFAVNFEVASDSTLSVDYLKAVLNTNTPQVLSAYPSTTATIEGRSAYQLAAGTVTAGVKRSYVFRMWLDEDAPQSEAQNRMLKGKIVVTATPVQVKIPTVAEECVGENAAQCISNYTTMYVSKDLDNNDPGQNTRYIGLKPNNYVTFNDEVWRIIGVFDVASSANGATEKRVKLIRNESIGNYSWDSSDSTVNGGWGVNEWSQADIMTTLNSGAYYNRTSGSCYTNGSNTTTACDFSTTGLTDEAKSLIGDAYWHTGTVDGVTNTYDKVTPVMMYESERSTNTSKICDGSTTECTDTVERLTGWVGKVGLMYPSDFSYAISDGETADRETCLNTALYEWNIEVSCHATSWLYNSDFQWVITPIPVSVDATNVILVFHNGCVRYNYAADASGVRPVVYLSADVKITGGDGSSENPYTLGI